MLRFIKMAGRPHLGLGVSVILLCFTLWIGDVPRAAAQGGSIVIDGNLLGGIIARGLLGKQQQPQQNYTPRTSGSRSRSTTRSASDSNVRKEPAKRIRSRAARHSAKPVREESRSKAGDVATSPPAQQQGTITHLNAEPSPALSVPPAAAPIPSAQAVGPVFAPPSAPPPPAATSTVQAPQPVGPGDTASAAIATSAEITLAQGHLQFMGYDIPQASGAVDLKTKIAIMQFQDSIGAPTTGLLTRGQLQMLFQKAATRLQGGDSPAERGVAAKESNGGDRPSLSESGEGDVSAAKPSGNGESLSRATPPEDDDKPAGRRARPKTTNSSDRKEVRAESRREGSGRKNSRNLQNLPKFNGETASEKRNIATRNPDLVPDDMGRDQRRDVNRPMREKAPRAPDATDAPVKAPLTGSKNPLQGLEPIHGVGPSSEMNPKSTPPATGSGIPRHPTTGVKTTGGSPYSGSNSGNRAPSRGPVFGPGGEQMQKQGTPRRLRLH
jgi:hypothetical protein